MVDILFVGFSDMFQNYCQVNSQYQQMSSSKSFRKKLPTTTSQAPRQPSKSPTPNPRNKSISGEKAYTEEQGTNRSVVFDKEKGQTPKKQKFESEMDAVEKQLKNNKNKLCSCMEIFTMLESSGQNQRCLQHNNILSLYCLNQRRILCVNCLYGIHKHRAHKVVPLKDTMDEVFQDNKQLHAIIQEEIKKIDYYSKMAEENAIVIESEMRKIIADMEGGYIKKISELKQKFETSKKQITENFQPLIDKCRTVKTALQDFRFSIWKAFTLYSDQKSTDEKQIMKQLLFVTIVQLCQFRNRTITKTQLQSLSRRLKQHF